MFCVISVPVAAQEVNQETLCRLLPAHQPVVAKPTEGVEYKAGIDVHGNPVIAADLGAPLTAVAQPVVIPIEVDLAQRFNLTLPAGVELKPTVATMRIHADGRVEYNGQDVSDQAYYLCGKGEGPPTQAEAAAENGAQLIEPAPSGAVLEGQYP